MRRWRFPYSIGAASTHLRSLCSPKSTTRTDKTCDRVVIKLLPNMAESTLHKKRGLCAKGTLVNNEKFDSYAFNTRRLLKGEKHNGGWL